MAHGGSDDINISSDETSDILCSVCKSKSKHQSAEKYCIECDDYYCATCINVHTEIPAMTKHKILDTAQISYRSINIQSTCTVEPGSSTRPQPLPPTERCQRHRRFFIDMYCKNHDEIGCVTCMTTDHRLCHITYIPEFLQNNVSDTHEIKKNLEATFNTLKVHQKQLQNEKLKLLTWKAESLEDIRKIRKEINDRFDELEQRTLKEVEDKYTSLINALEEPMKLLDMNIVNVLSARDKITAIGNNVSQDFVNAKKGKRAVERAAKCLEKDQTFTFTEDMKFISDQKLLDLLKETQVLGMLMQESAKATGGIERQLTTGRRTTTTEPLLQVKGSHSYSVQVKSDKSSCSIVSACSMEDGTIILSDKLNKKLKRLDSSTFTVIDYCDLPGAPQQVCTMNRQQVAVCLPQNKQVAFIKVKKRMTTSSKITTDFECYCVAHASGNFYISDASSVYVYSVNGEKLKEISKDNSDQPMFTHISSLAVNQDGSRIYVADKENGLIFLDINGHTFGEISGTQLYGASCCFIGKGSLLVCGSNSNNVLQFGLNGELIGEVVKPIGHNYMAICCNQNMSKMVVANDEDYYSYDTVNKIEVYDLS